MFDRVNHPVSHQLYSYLVFAFFTWLSESINSAHDSLNLPAPTEHLFFNLLNKTDPAMLLIHNSIKILHFNGKDDLYLASLFVKGVAHCLKHQFLMSEFPV